MSGCQFCGEPDGPDVTHPEADDPPSFCCPHAYCASEGHTLADPDREHCSICGDLIRVCENCGGAFLPGEWDDPSLTHNDPDSNGRVHEACCRQCRAVRS